MPKLGLVCRISGTQITGCQIRFLPGACWCLCCLRHLSPLIDISCKQPIPLLLFPWPEKPFSNNLEQLCLQICFCRCLIHFKWCYATVYLCFAVRRDKGLFRLFLLRLDCAYSRLAWKVKQIKTEHLSDWNFMKALVAGIMIFCSSR